jgi:hypothetical protein
MMTPPSIHADDEINIDAIEVAAADIAERFHFAFSPFTPPPFSAGYFTPSDAAPQHAARRTFDLRGCRRRCFAVYASFQGQQTLSRSFPVIILRRSIFAS